MGIVDLTCIEKYILVESTFQRGLLIRGVWTNFESSNSPHIYIFILKRTFVLSDIKGRLKQVFRRPSAILLLSRN